MSGLVVTALDPALAAIAAAVVERGFARHVAPDFDDAGRVAFRMFAASRAIRDRIAQGGTGALARVDGAPAGYGELARLELGDTQAHLLLLFTDPDHTRRGVARAVLAHLLAGAPSVTTVTVNASPFAIPAYERLGFVSTGPLERREGFTFMPMRRGS